MHGIVYDEALATMVFSDLVREKDRKDWDSYINSISERSASLGWEI